MPCVSSRAADARYALLHGDTAGDRRFLLPHAGTKRICRCLASSEYGMQLRRVIVLVIGIFGLMGRCGCTGGTGADGTLPLGHEYVYRAFAHDGAGHHASGVEARAMALARGARGG